AQRFTMSNDLLDHFVGVANQQRALGTPLGVETRAADRGPSALPRDTAHRTSVAGEEVIGGFFRGGGDIAERVHAHLQLIRRVPRLLARLPVEIDERTEAPRF